MKQLYANKLDKKAQNPWKNKLSKQEIENWNTPISIKETEFEIKDSPTKKTSGPDELTGEFYHIFKEKIIKFKAILHKNHKTEKWTLKKIQQIYQFYTNSFRKENRHEISQLILQG